MRVMDTGSTNPTTSSSLTFLQNISAGCHYNWKHKNVKQTNVKRTNTQGSTVVCCYSAFVTSVHSIMTNGLPRVKLPRFSIVTIVYHTYIGISNEIHISINYRGYPTNPRLHGQSPVEDVRLIVTYSNYNARSGLPTILVAPSQSTRLCKYDYIHHHRSVKVIQDGDLPHCSMQHQP